MDLKNKYYQRLNLVIIFLLFFDLGMNRFKR